MKTRELAMFGLMILLSTSIFAQNNTRRFGFELNSGASFPVKEINGTSLKTGFGFEGLLHYRVLSHWGVYAGWGWNKLSADQSFVGEDVCFEETGYVFGIQFMHPIGDRPISYYLRGAGLYNHIEIENSEGNITHDTGHGFGFQLAGGISFDLGRNWSLTPGVKFNALNRTSDFEGESKSLDYQYISARVGIVKKF